MNNDVSNSNLLDDSVADNFSEFRLFKIGNLNIGKPTEKQKAKDEARAIKKAGKQEVKAACGKRPLFAGAKKDAWNICVGNIGGDINDVSLETETEQEATPPVASPPATSTSSTPDTGIKSGDSGSGDDKGLSAPAIAGIAVASLAIIVGGILLYKKFA